jgi:hypothetical protein
VAVFSHPCNDLVLTESSSVTQSCRGIRAFRTAGLCPRQRGNVVFGPMFHTPARTRSGGRLNL